MNAAATSNLSTEHLLLLHKKVTHPTHQSNDEENVTKLTAETIKKLRRALDVVDIEDINRILCKYEEIVALIECRYPNLSIGAKADWALAQAMNPAWFSDSLSTRMNNTMLVSALLITVCSSYFIAPPDCLEPGSITRDVFCYICGLCNILFLVSITFGVIYVENAMSRAFGQSERFALLMSQYAIKNASQTTMVIGSLLFPVMIAIPMYENFGDVNASIMWGFYFIGFVLMFSANVYCAREAAAEQLRRVNLFLPFCDKENRLRPEYHPSIAPMTFNDWKEMYKCDRDEKNPDFVIFNN